MRQVSARLPFGDPWQPRLVWVREGNREKSRASFKNPLQVRLRGLGHDDEPWMQTSDGNAPLLGASTWRGTSPGTTPVPGRTLPAPGTAPVPGRTLHAPGTAPVPGRTLHALPTPRSGRGRPRSQGAPCPLGPRPSSGARFMPFPSAAAAGDGRAPRAPHAPWDRARPRAHAPCPPHAPQRPGTAALPGRPPMGLESRRLNAPTRGLPHKSPTKSVTSMSASLRILPNNPGPIVSPA